MGRGLRAGGGGLQGEGSLATAVGRGRARRRSAGVCPRGRRAAQARAPPSPRARSRLSPRSHPSGRDEMRGGGAGLALLASLLWVAAQGQQRGEPGSRPGPLAGGRLRDKAPRPAAPEVGARIRVHPRPGFRHVGLPRGPWKSRPAAGERAGGAPLTDAAPSSAPRASPPRASPPRALSPRVRLGDPGAPMESRAGPALGRGCGGWAENEWERHPQSPRHRPAAESWWSAAGKGGGTLATRGGPARGECAGRSGRGNRPRAACRARPRLPAALGAGPEVAEPAVPSQDRRWSLRGEGAGAKRDLDAGWLREHADSRGKVG